MRSVNACCLLNCGTFFEKFTLIADTAIFSSVWRVDFASPCKYHFTPFESVLYSIASVNGLTARFSFLFPASQSPMMSPFIVRSLEETDEASCVVPMDPADCVSLILISSPSSPAISVIQNEVSGEKITSFPSHLYA